MHFFPIRWAKITKHWQNTKHTYLTIWTEDVYQHNSIFVHSHKPCTVMVYYNNLSCQNFSILPPNHFLIVIVVLETFKSYTLKVFIRYHGSFFTTQWENSLVSNVSMFFNEMGMGCSSLIFFPVHNLTKKRFLVCFGYK